MYRITIEEITQEDALSNDPSGIERHRQIVDALDLKKIVDAINHKPRVYTKRAKKGGEQA